MHDLIKFLSPVVDRTPGSGIYGAYLFRNGTVTARNRTIEAGAELESAIDFAVPAVELDAVLGRIKQITALSVEGDSLLIKGGRLKSTIQLCSDEAPEPGSMPEEWCDVSPEFHAALKTAVQFVGDRQWSMGVRLWNNRVTAAGTRSAVDITLPGLEVPIPTLIPTATVEVVVGKEQKNIDPPSQIGVGDGFVTFRWADGRWLRSQLLALEMPESTIQAVFTKAGEEKCLKVTDDMREAVAHAAAMSDGYVDVTAAGFQGRKGVGKTFAEYDMKLPEDHVSRWEAKALEAVLETASWWNPTLYPDLCPFGGDRVRGAVIGVRAR